MGRADSQIPVAIDADLQAQFAALGVAADIDAPIIPADTEVFEVMPCNWQSVCAFLACETQWQALPMTAGHGMGGIGTSVIWLGLIYPAVDVVLRRLGLADEVFGDLQVMERAALDAFAEVSA